jgi:hypothetical protein
MRATVDARIQSIELILSAERGGRRGTEAASMVAAGADSDAGSERAGRTQTSLRKKVLETIRRVPGSKSSEIAQMIQDDGFRIGGATSLRNRVSHEISQLRKQGAVRRDVDGFYAVPGKVSGGAGTESRAVAS